MFRSVGLPAAPRSVLWEGPLFILADVKALVGSGQHTRPQLQSWTELDKT